MLLVLETNTFRYSYRSFILYEIRTKTATKCQNLNFWRKGFLKGLVIVLVKIHTPPCCYVLMNHLEEPSTQLNSIHASCFAQSIFSPISVVASLPPLALFHAFLSSLNLNQPQFLLFLLYGGLNERQEAYHMTWLREALKKLVFFRNIS